MKPHPITAVWIALQVLFLAGWAMREEARQEQGVSILVRTAPVDPRDLLRGQYLQLGYELSRPPAVEEGVQPEEGDEVWVVLAPDGEFHTPVRSSLARPADLARGEVALRGRHEGWQVVYGIERYFVPEGTETPERGDLTVRLRVGDDGSPRIEEVYVRGEPWP